MRAAPGHQLLVYPSSPGQYLPVCLERHVAPSHVARRPSTSASQGCCGQSRESSFVSSPLISPLSLLSLSPPNSALVSEAGVSTAQNEPPDKAERNVRVWTCLVCVCPDTSGPCTEGQGSSPEPTSASVDTLPLQPQQCFSSKRWTFSSNKSPCRSLAYGRKR